MKSFVITIFDNQRSVESAKRCIDSGAKQGYDIEMFRAITPQNNDVFELAKTMGINPDDFKEKWSRQDNCVAAFLSHFTLWGQSLVSGEEVQIFEHDAVIVNRLPEFIAHTGCINLGKPSYGKWQTPGLFGVNPLTSKKYFPGAHAYRVNPLGARQLIAEAKKKAGPTDVFLNLDRFPWLQEYYPWPVEAQDTFTTIQRAEGCQAKHNYGPDYEIL